MSNQNQIAQLTQQIRRLNGGAEFAKEMESLRKYESTMRKIPNEDLITDIQIVIDKIESLRSGLNLQNRNDQALDDLLWSAKNKLEDAQIECDK